MLLKCLQQNAKHKGFVFFTSVCHLCSVYEQCDIGSYEIAYFND